MIRCVMAVVGLLAGWSAATAGPIFQANLSGGQEVPPRLTQASGSGFIQFNDALTSVQVHLQVSNIQNIVGAHIHFGAAGVNGPIVLDFGSFPQLDVPGTTTLVDATFTQANLSGPFANNFAAFYNAAITGRLYFNVHTNDGVAPTNTGPGDFPGGEVRGQLAIAPEPGTLLVFGLLGAGGAVTVWRRRKPATA